MFPLPAPMLATSGRPNVGLDDWTVEVKLDGWRAIVGVSSEGYQVRTRRGRSIGDRLPELRALTAFGIDAVLDGELIAGAGRPAEFYELAGAMAASRRDLPVCFVAFDVLRLDGTSLLNVPQQERRQLLQQLAALTDDTLPVVPSYPGGDLDDVLAGCEELALEGVVIKRHDARYLPGRRSNGWRKAKAPSWSAHRAQPFSRARR
jgi:bifunctional non-homologous end joining protein LigD